MNEIVGRNCNYRVAYPARRVCRNKSVLGPRGNNDYTTNATRLRPSLQRAMLKLGQLEPYRATEVIGVSGLLNFADGGTPSQHLQQQIGDADQEAVVLLPPGATIFGDRLDNQSLVR